ncbi:MAG: hypothetical protein HYX55_00180 [Chloroflexi bacterium]|nr:hypothetical protein [Chloroflexota bacterium]
MIDLLARVPALGMAVLLTLVAACGSAAPTAPAASASVPASPMTTATGATAGPSLDRNAGWRADIAMLVPGMAAIHPNLTHGVSRADLDAAGAALAATVETATDDQLMVGVLRIVAMVSKAGCDAHTGAYIWGSGTYPVDSMPLRLWLFGDEVVVVDALPPYRGLIGSRIDTIEGHPIADVMAAIDPIVPRDNAQTVRLLMPRFLLIPQVLRGLGLAEGGVVSLALTAVDGAQSNVDVQPISMAAYNAWAGPYGLHLPANPNVLYLSLIDEPLWWKVAGDGDTLFVQYNRVDPLPTQVLGDLGNALRAPDYARVVLDLRHNFGGELSALDPIQALFEDPAIGAHDRLFVLTGRNTFSAGSLLVARLDKDTDAVIVGEPMGGCPTIWSDPSDVALPWSGIVVSVADDVAVGVDPVDPRLTIEPDTVVTLTREDWADGRDPALDLIVAAPP